MHITSGEPGKPAGCGAIRAGPSHQVSQCQVITQQQPATGVSSFKSLLTITLIISQPHTPHIVVEADRSDIKDPRPGRRKSYAPTHYGRNSSFRHRDGSR